MTQRRDSGTVATFEIRDQLDAITGSQTFARAKRLSRLLSYIVEQSLDGAETLKAQYCFAVDQRRWDEFLELFLEDAVWEMPDIMRFEGKAAIKDFFAGLDEMMSFWMHMVVNPLITVDGDEAQGRWYVLESNTVKDGPAIWGAGRYEERYRRSNGQWLFQEIKLLPIFWSRYEDGWAKNPNILAGD